MNAIKKYITSFFQEAKSETNYETVEKHELSDAECRKQLFNAISSQNILSLKYFLEKGYQNTVSSNQNITEEQTVLQFASASGNAEMVRMLLDFGEKIGTSCKQLHLKTALHFAFESGDVEIVKVLLDRNADIAAITDYGATCLHLAAQRANLNVIDFIFSADCSRRNEFVRILEVKDKHGCTALHLASQQGHVAVVKTLLLNNADCTTFDLRNCTALNSACIAGYLDVVQVLLDAGASVNVIDQDGGSPLSYACCNKTDAKLLIMLLKAVAKVDVKDDSNDFVIDIQSRLKMRAHAAGFKHLIDPLNGMTMLHLASVEGCQATVKLLLKVSDLIGINKDAITFVDQMSALHLACENHMKTIHKLRHSLSGVCEKTLEIRKNEESVSIVRALLENKVNIEAKTRNGSTALHLMCVKGDVTLVKLLLEFGAKVDSVDLAGKTPLDVAQSQEVKQVLLQVVT